MSSKRISKFLLRLTSKESEEFDNLIERLENECDMSHQKQSEVIFQGFKNYAEHLLSTYIPTQTKSQSSLQERKQAIYSIIDSIKEKGYMSISKAFIDMFYQTPSFIDIKIRTKSNYFQQLLISDEIAYIYLPFYFNFDEYNKENIRKKIYLIHKKSRWYPQLKELCFYFKEENLVKITHDTMTDTEFRDKLYKRFFKIAKQKKTLDKAEQTILNAFLSEIGELKDKPMVDNTDITLQTVIQLRYELKYKEANEELEKETQHKKTQAIIQYNKFIEGVRR